MRPRAIRGTTRNNAGRLVSGASLERFVAAQDGGIYSSALAEVLAGEKRGHWMWFVFPQIAGLGRSATAQFYAIRGREEAVAYSGHLLLGPRLVEITRAMLGWSGRKSAESILGDIDAMKFCSSMTLFEAVSPRAGVYGEAIEVFFAGDRDRATLDRL